MREDFLNTYRRANKEVFIPLFLSNCLEVQEEYGALMLTSIRAESGSLVTFLENSQLSSRLKPKFSLVSNRIKRE